MEQDDVYRTEPHHRPRPRPSRVGNLPRPGAWPSGPEHLTIEHYAFLVSEEEFDRIFERIQARGLPYWADPAHKQPGRINHHDGGRGVYWNDPNGHYLEIITRPYGSDS